MLVVQDPQRESEVMVVGYRGGLRLARRGDRHQRFLAPEAGLNDVGNWVALDTGDIIRPERLVGSVIGIVMALL